MTEQKRIQSKINKLPNRRNGACISKSRTYRLDPDVIEEMKRYSSMSKYISVLVRESQERRLNKK